ncbi:hypothetical protein LWM68_40935 [Niabella sp. W65]|nr:hypothetical protein [Niabella sp. W65]MCH7368539.1 hypothetical protein [Niabella sp. W65]
MSTKNKAIAKKLFETYPEETAAFFTSDGTSFFNENNALLHGKTLADKSVTEIKKADLSEEKEVKLVKLKLTKAMIAALPQIGEAAKEGDTIEVTAEKAEEYKAAAAAIK